MRLADKAATMARRGAPLPYDAEVEWIGFRGNQAGALFKIPKDFDDATVHAKFFHNNDLWNNNNIHVFGSNYLHMSLAVYGEGGYVGINGGEKSFTHELSNNLVIDYNIPASEGNDGDFLLNGVVVANVRGAKTIAGRGLSIFERDGLYSTSGFNGTIYYLRVVDKSGVLLLLDLKPVVKDGEAFLYDAVEGVMYPNFGRQGAEIGPVVVSSSRGGGTKSLTPRRSYRRLARPSARFCAHSHRWEVAA